MDNITFGKHIASKIIWWLTSLMGIVLSLNTFG